MYDTRGTEAGRRAGVESEFGDLDEVYVLLEGLFDHAAAAYSTSVINTAAGAIERASAIEAEGRRAYVFRTVSIAAAIDFLEGKVVTPLPEFIWGSWLDFRRAVLAWPEED